MALNRAHWTLVVVLTISLAVDAMKPATLGFVMPGLSAEYGIPRSQAGLLALFALTGTTVGSVLWGRIADRFGRRAAILLSALMFIGTAICGAMPSFGWNLAMCFLIGASAGGLLPITFTPDGRGGAGAPPRLAAGGARRRRHLGRLHARGRLGGLAGAALQLARAVAAAVEPAVASALLAALDLRSTAATTVATAALLVAVSGVIAMLMPYAAEIYPVHLRGSGSGVVAASSKFGGILGALLALVGFLELFALSAVLLALPMAASAAMLLRSGVALEDIQRALR